MALYLDSAIVEEAQIASQLGWVKGITTNPKLLSKSEGSVKEILRSLAVAIPGEVFYQPTAPDLDGMLKEGYQVYNLLYDQTVLKIPATSIGFQAAARLSQEIPCAITAVFSPAQALVAMAVGATYVIPYVNRSTRLLGDGLALVRDIAVVLKGSQAKILAASIKSPEEALETYKAGASILTLPLALLQEMAVHELSNQATEEFARTGRGISF
ncbi:MAG: transaldolase family protein [Anaerolineales bacterium]|jgi:transaldolase